MSIIANHLSEIKPSAVSVMSAKAMDMERQGRDIVRLTSGEPDFPTPDHIKMAAIKALAEDRTKYPQVVGLPELREAVCEKLRRDNGLAYAPDQVIVSTGCKQVLYNAMTVTLNPDDEVLLPSPYWMSYPAIVRLSRGKPVFLPTKRADGFKLKPEVLEQAITPRTRWLFLNSPSNPSGAVYSREDLAPLADVLRRHSQVWILCDDIYEFLVFDDAKFVSILNVAPDLTERTLVVNGFSKAFCMPGWRLGYGAGPVELVKAMFKLQSQSTSGANIISQVAGVSALLGDQSFFNKHNQAYRERRDMVVSLLDRIDGLSCDKPEGAFYCFVDCREIIGRKTPQGKTISNDEDWAGYLLDEVGVALIPGTPFGLSPFFRVSFAASLEKLQDGCERIAKACSRLS